MLDEFFINRYQYRQLSLMEPEMTAKSRERANQLMKVLVEHYLRNGQPLGSGTLAELSELSVSSATIRNILGSLEQQGLVESPHTSAGRIPTDQGFRLFVDHLLTVKIPQQTTVEHMTAKLDPYQPTQQILSDASQLLSELTQMASLVKVPSRRITRIKHIEFMPLTEKRVLVVLVLNDQEVQNRVIYTEHGFTQSELVQATNFVNRHLAGQEIKAARKTLLDRMRQEKHHLDRLMQLAIELADKSLEEATVEDGYHLSGDKNLLDIAENSLDLHDLKGIFDAFQQKQQVLALLDKALEADGVQIFIGEENATEGLKPCSVVTAPYEIDGSPVGVLAVVGPTRMRYDKVIPIVDITAKLLSSTLNQSE